MNTKAFEALGGVIKEELLNTVDEFVIQNSFVLETIDPFPGYHSDIPVDSVPPSVFLVCKDKLSREEVCRASKQIKKYYSKDFDAAWAEIFVYNHHFHGIRLKKLGDYSSIAELQSNFMNEGFEFRKTKSVNDKCIIRVRKSFLLEEVDEGIFMDKRENYFSYFLLPDQLSWKIFEKLTYSVRNNYRGKHFDAALGYFYHNFEIEDVVRIYMRNFDLSAMQKLKELYLSHLDKIW